MPFIEVTVLEGTSEEKVDELIEAVTEGVQLTAGSPRESIRILVRAVPATSWASGGRRLTDQDAS